MSLLCRGGCLLLRSICRDDFLRLLDFAEPDFDVEGILAAFDDHWFALREMVHRLGVADDGLAVVAEPRRAQPAQSAFDNRVDAMVGRLRDPLRSSVLSISDGSAFDGTEYPTSEACGVSNDRESRDGKHPIAGDGEFASIFLNLSIRAHRRGPAETFGPLPSSIIKERGPQKCLSGDRPCNPY